MKVIGIELDNVLRNRNYQIAKYYTKEIDKTLDIEDIDISVFDSAAKLFKSKKAREKFLYEDFPYELYGCARAMEKDIVTILNQWTLEHEDEYEVILYSPMEGGITIQSTYFFLSKTGCRVRKVYFPIKTQDIWKLCDIVITANKKVINTKPNDKQVIGIAVSDNKTALKECDEYFNSLNDTLKNSSILLKGVEKSKKVSIFYKIRNIFKK